MDRFTWIYKLHGVFGQRHTPLSKAKILAELGYSTASVERITEEMRDYLGAPIKYSQQDKGYYYSDKAFELPGLWFSAEELHGLLICQMLLENFSLDSLQKAIKELQIRIEKLLVLQQQPIQTNTDKLRIIYDERQLRDESQFIKIVTNLINNNQIAIQYRVCGDNATKIDRKLSPHGLIYYQGNWYLLAWCHAKEDLRFFAVGRIRSVKTLAFPAKIVEQQILKQYTDCAYGIFTGLAKHTAELVFTPERAKWITDETWHPDQQGQWLKNGNYQLTLPFNDSRELVMDILKHGSEVKVIAPDFLIQIIKQQISAMQINYSVSL